MARRITPWAQRAVVMLMLCQPSWVLASASLTGQSGLIQMPDARLQPEGVWRIGISNSDPYFAGWSSLSVFPRFEFSGRFTRIDDVPGFAADTDYGDYKDKAFDAKALLWREGTYLPGAAVGAQDFTGTRLFRARYLALSKRLGDADITFGYGAERIDGVFGGIRYVPSWHRRLGVLVEYDAYRYTDDFEASRSGADRRDGGVSYGLEYRLGWLTTQLSVQDDETGANVYVSVPLMRTEFVPKIHEPAPTTVEPSGQSRETWRSNPAAAQQLLQRLHAAGFVRVSARLEGERLRLTLTHTRISLIGRAVGRAARIALAAGPDDIRELEIVYTYDDMPLLTYTFTELAQLRRYFEGAIDETTLRRHVTIRTEQPTDEVAPGDTSLEQSPVPTVDIRYGEDGHLVALERRDSWLSGLYFVPFNARIFFNDPSGAFRYDVFATINFDRRLAPGWFAEGSARFTLSEDVSEVTQVSNSTLPHVRSDIVDYRREGARLRLESLLINRYRRLAEPFFLRASAGYYEEMYAGIGTQLLYLPPGRSWAFDLAVDAVRQREPGESFGFRDYRTVTALGALHYRFARRGITLTARFGRFLARDEGVRWEFRRRFRSGVEAGAWYTVTNGDDETGPGSPGDPYRDKGLFVSIPLNSMLTRDTQRRADLAVVDFTRDVGQMVRSPGDLYLELERELHLNAAETHALTQFDK